MQEIDDYLMSDLSTSFLDLAARVLFEHSFTGAALVDIERGTFLRVNSAFCSIVGYAEAELKRMTWRDITVNADAGPDLQQVKWLLAGEITSYEMDKRYLSKRGHVVWVRLRVDPVKSAEEEIVCLLAQITMKFTPQDRTVSPSAPISTDLALAQWITANKPIAVAIGTTLVGMGATLATLLKWLKGM